MSKQKEVIQKIQEPKFSKEQILKSKLFRHNTDLVRVLLTDDGLYTIDEVTEQIENYLKGEVK